MGLCNQDKPKSERKQFTWDSFLEYYNQRIDEEIIMFCRSNNQMYYGGKCNISACVKEDEFTKVTQLIVISVLYYKEQFTKKVIERTINSKFDYREFKKDEETQSMLRSILRTPIELNIESPLIENQGGKE